MTERERFIAALERRPITGRVPHFELVFFLTMEVLGKPHPSQLRFSQWNQMSENERRLQRESMANLYIDIAEKYFHSAIFVHPNPGDLEETIRLLEIIREKTNDKYFLLMHGDATYSMPSGDDMMEYTAAFYDEPERMKNKADQMVNRAIEKAEKLSRHKGLLDGFGLCSDYCFNTNPFFNPSMFDEFVTPYLKKLIKAYRDMGFYTIKHTDGNIMPIIESLVECNPHALHSIDPQAGVSLKAVKQKYGDKVALAGNVNCGLLQTGTDEEVIADVERSLNDGMPGGGYIFCTSNCVYTGMPLERYELLHSIWMEKGVYNAVS